MEGDWDLCIYGTYSDDSEYIKKLQDTGCNVITPDNAQEYLDKLNSLVA